MINKKSVKLSTKAKGAYYEQQACHLLEQAGYQIVATNWTQAKVGEIDIIARHDTAGQGCLVFVEVKARTYRHAHYGCAIEQVTYAKQKKLILTAQHFIMRHEAYCHDTMRFDVIGFDVIDNRQSVHWIKNAFLA